VLKNRAKRVELQLINFPILNYRQWPSIPIDREAREKTSPISYRRFSYTCAPWVTDNGWLSGPADKTGSPPCARPSHPSRPSPISQSSLLARYTTCTHTWRRVAKLGGGNLETLTLARAYACSQHLLVQHGRIPHRVTLR